MSILSFMIPEGYQGTIQSFLIHTKIKSSYVNELIFGKKIMINQEIIRKDVPIKSNDFVQIDFSFMKEPTIHLIDKTIDIIYEDAFFCAVYKPIGLLVYDDSNKKDNLTSRVNAHYQKHDHPFSVLPAHRIDVDTSGIVLFGKNPLSISFLSNLFESKDIEKTYLAIVEGLVVKDGFIKKRIALDRHSNKMRISETGKDAYTSYKVLKKMGNETFLKIMIAGGRKHQIRVHLSSIGHPIKGDILYGSKDERLYLHFYQTKFRDLYGNVVTIQTDIPFYENVLL